MKQRHRKESEMFGGGIVYLLNDTFTTDRAAGAVNGTAAEPGPGFGNRVVTDTENKITISSGALTGAGGKASPAWGDPRCSTTTGTARAAGKILAVQYASSNVDKHFRVGFSNANNSLTGNHYYVITNLFANSLDQTVAGVRVFTPASATSYTLLVLLRATGAFYVVKGGTLTYPTLLWISATDSAATVYPMYFTYDGPYTSQFVKISSLLWLPAPLLSDGCAGTYPATDGAGHAESTGLGAGGSGKTWTATGTWDNTTVAGKLSCTALSGGLGILVSDVSKTDCHHQAALTRAGNEVGIICNYVDADNYIRGIHDGTNVKLIKRVAGVETEVVSAATAYSASAKLVVRSIGTSYYIWYNDTYVGAGTISDAGVRAGTKVGLYTTNTGNTGDNVVTYATGTSNEHAFLNLFTE